MNHKLFKMVKPLDITCLPDLFHFISVFNYEKERDILWKKRKLVREKLFFLSFKDPSSSLDPGEQSFSSSVESSVRKKCRESSEMR